MATGDAKRSYPPPGRAEPLWPALLTILVAIALQALLPNRLAVDSRWLLPALEAVALILLIIVSPLRITRPHSLRRRVGLAVAALVSVANAIALGQLTHYLLSHNVQNGRALILSGALIWLTNVLLFSLWYWELDRGGPGLRSCGQDGLPDFQFPQMSGDSLEPEWRPQFVDYLYVSLTNALAFSPTDTMPLSAAAKLVMGLQSLISVVTIGLVISRAINIL